MLYRFILENYKSFRNRNEFSLIPSKDDFLHVAYSNTNVPVLRDLVIYGANASGKSNVVKALAFLKNIVLDNQLLSQSRNVAFRLSQQSIESPSIFVAEIRLENMLYQYALVVSFKESKVIAETLKNCVIGEKTWNPIFAHVFDTETNSYNLTFMPTNSGSEKRYDVYRSDLENCANKLVLTEMAEKGIGGDSFADAINEVYHWFEELMILFPNTEYNLVGAIADNQVAVNELYKKYFKIFNIDIEEICLKEIPAEYVRMPQNVLTEIKQGLLKSSDESYAMVHGKRHDMLVQIDQLGELHFLDVNFKHKKDDFEQLFESCDESDGTKRLFDLIPMLGYLVDSNRVAVIDEIDRSLHCLLTREMLRYYLDNSKKRKSQLICTTHDVLLMDGNLLGRNEIWFVDKTQKESSLYPLAKYKFGDSTMNISRNYLVGRFGGKPKF